MPSQLKSDTARANGAKSHGPKTAEGRATSSRNATKHGLSSRNPVVLECENDEDFHALHDSQMEILQPATPAEKDLVDQMVAARWRILRLQSIESEILDTELRRQKEVYEGQAKGKKVQISDAYTLEANHSRAMALASRCEARHNRTYQSTYKVLRELQATRAKQSTQPTAEPRNPESPEHQRRDGFQPERAPEAANRIVDIKPKSAVLSDASGGLNPDAGARAIRNPADSPSRNRESDASL